ncbi:chloride channel protein [Pedobacter sp. NJ-S-72]
MFRKNVFSDHTKRSYGWTRRFGRIRKSNAVTGAAIGSNFAQTYKLDYRERTLLLAAGATAGIASAFNAPIAGMMFAFEILLTGVVFSDFIPLVVAAVCGSLVSRIALQEDVLFRFHAREAFNYHNILYYLLLGLLTGLYARYFVVVSQWVEHFFYKLKLSRLQKAAIGGLILSLLCVLFPPLFGEGYETVKSFTMEMPKVYFTIAYSDI